MTKKLEHPEWFFMWTKPEGKEYVTMVCAWTKREAMEKAAADQQLAWKEIYARGGRAVRVRMVLA